MSTGPTEPLFHGKFIPDDPQRLPLPGRIAIGVGVSLVIVVLAFVSMDVLNSWGVWVTLLLVSVFTATTVGLWIRDAVRHPATEPDDSEAS